MSQRHNPVFRRFTMVGVASIAAVFLVLLDTAAGVDADERIPAGPVAVPTEVTISANADTYVDSGKPDINHGGAANLYVSLYGSPVNIQQTLVQFSLAAIPAGATIDTARLELYLNSASGLSVVNLGLGRNLALWKENEVVFSSRPGCPPTGASANVGVTNGWYGWDATALVAQWVQGFMPNYGVCVTGAGSGSLYMRRFTSREGGLRRA